MERNFLKSLKSVGLAIWSAVLSESWAKPTRDKIFSPRSPFVLLEPLSDYFSKRRLTVALCPSSFLFFAIHLSFSFGGGVKKSKSVGLKLWGTEIGSSAYQLKL